VGQVRETRKEEKGKREKGREERGEEKSREKKEKGKKRENWNKDTLTNNYPPSRLSGKIRISKIWTAPPVKSQLKLLVFILGQFSGQIPQIFAARKSIYHVMYLVLDTFP